MQILIQGSSRRIKFTKSEVGKLKASAEVLCALDRMVHDSGVSAIREHLDAVLGRISVKYEYTEPQPGAEGAK